MVLHQRKIFLPDTYFVSDPLGSCVMILLPPEFSSSVDSGDILFLRGIDYRVHLVRLQKIHPSMFDEPFRVAFCEVCHED